MVELWACQCGFTGLPGDYSKHVHNPEPWPFIKMPPYGPYMVVEPDSEPNVDVLSLD